MAATAPALPHWDMTVVYPSLESPEFATGFESVVRGIDELRQLFDAEGIGEQSPAALDAPTVAAFKRVVECLNEVLAARQTLTAYISGFVSTNSRDNLAQAKRSELEIAGVRLAQL